MRAAILGLCTVVAACAGGPSRAQPAAGAASPLQGLIGCWFSPGAVQGKATQNLVRGAWRLGQRYLLLEVHGLDPADPYDAAIVMADAGQGAVTAFWMDSFGGAYSVSGSGRAEPTGIVVSYAYPDATYVNRFIRTSNGWDWRVTEERANQAPELFASYALTPTSCADMPNVF